MAIGWGCPLCFFRCCESRGSRSTRRVDRFLHWLRYSPKKWGAHCRIISRSLGDAEVDSDFYTQVHLMSSRILTVPNQLTFLRLAFLPVFLIAIEYERYELALGILVAAGVSDALDGLLARRLNQRTPLGAYLDPIADKLLLSSSYFILALKGKIAWWLTILVLGRDVLILVACAVILITVGYRPFPPSIWGKAAT